MHRPISTPRVQLRRLLTACLWTLAAATPLAHAQPKTPVRLLVGFSPGGAVDAAARVLAEGLSRELGQTVIVENRPGAGGQLAAQALKAAAPDGHTLMLTNDHTVAILPLTVKQLNFDTVKDFVPVAMLTNRAVIMLATAEPTGVRSLRELPAWSRQHPGQANFGVPAPGSIPEFAVGLIGRALQVDASPVAYRGGAPMVIDLAAGQIPFGLTSKLELMPFVKSGKLRPLAVSGEARSADLPDVPTFAELGIRGLEQSNVMGFYAPAGTPPTMVGRYGEALKKLLAEPRMRERLETTSFEPHYGPPEQLAQEIARIASTWAPVIRQSGFQPQ